MPVVYPPPELPIGRAASIRTCLASRKPQRPRVVVNFSQAGSEQLGTNDGFGVATNQELLREGSLLAPLESFEFLERARPVRSQ